MSELKRLGRLFEFKYGLLSIAASPSEIFAQVKRDILTNYSNWVMSNKYRALKILAEGNEPYAVSLYVPYTELVANIDSLNHIQVFHKVNAILDTIRKMKKEPLGYRSSIHDSVAIGKDADKNYRERLKSGFETNLTNISFGLSKVAEKLKKFVANSQLHGGPVDPQRKELSRDQLLVFMKTPAAQKYKLDSFEMMEQILFYPETKHKLTTLINAISRGHIPIDGPAIMEEAKSIRNWLDLKEKTNVPALNSAPQKEPNENLLEKGEAWNNKMAKKYNDSTLERYTK